MSIYWRLRFQPSRARILPLYSTALLTSHASRPRHPILQSVFGYHSQVIPLASQSGGRGLEDEEPSKTSCLTTVACLHVGCVVTSEVQLICTTLVEKGVC